MKKEFRLITEGVLVLASAQALANEYRSKTFNYDFPDGLAALLLSNHIIALMTSEGDDLFIDIQYETPLKRIDFDKVIEQALVFHEQDELLILSHADFTMICDGGGRYQDYGWPLKFVEPIAKGNYKIQLGIVDVSEEFEKYNAYYKITISIIKINDELTTNAVIEIAE